MGQSQTGLLYPPPQQADLIKPPVLSPLTTAKQHLLAEPVKLDLRIGTSVRQQFHPAFWLCLMICLELGESPRLQGKTETTRPREFHSSSVQDCMTKGSRRPLPTYIIQLLRIGTNHLRLHAQLLILALFNSHWLLSIQSMTRPRQSHAKGVKVETAWLGFASHPSPQVLGVMSLNR